MLCDIPLYRYNTILFISCCQTFGLFLFFNYYKYFFDEHSWYKYSGAFLRVSFQEKILGKGMNVHRVLYKSPYGMVIAIYTCITPEMFILPHPHHCHILSFFKLWQFDMLLLFSFLSLSHIFMGITDTCISFLWSVHIFCPFFFHDFHLDLSLNKNLCHIHVYLYWNKGIFRLHS